MDTTISELKNEFVKIIDQIGKIQAIKMSTHLKITRFKTIYDEMIHLNSAKKHFLVCLEALHFQYKMFVAEQESLTKTLALLVNRVYRDYYHYYNMIAKELAKYEITQPVVEKHHLVYKDTEPNAEFQAEDIMLVFDNMVALLNSISLKYNENEAVIRQYKTRSTTGIFIGNLINTLEYDNSVLDDHAKLFFNGVDFMIKTQSAYFAKLLKRFQSAIEDIDGEVSFNDSSLDPTHTEQPVEISTLGNADASHKPPHTEQPVDINTLGNADASHKPPVQTTDDGNAQLLQWIRPNEEEDPCVVGMTIDEIHQNNA